VLEIALAGSLEYPLGQDCETFSSLDYKIYVPGFRRAAWNAVCLVRSGMRPAHGGGAVLSVLKPRTGRTCQRLDQVGLRAAHLANGLL
jgi:hypothetical protein